MRSSRLARLSSGFDIAARLLASSRLLLLRLRTLLLGALGPSALAPGSVLAGADRLLGIRRGGRLCGCARLLCLACTAPALYFTRERCSRKERRSSDGWYEKLPHHCTPSSLSYSPPWSQFAITAGKAKGSNASHYC